MNRIELIAKESFNPYSNGSSFFISGSIGNKDVTEIGFNPYSNGSSFFIVVDRVKCMRVNMFQSLF